MRPGIAPGVLLNQPGAAARLQRVVIGPVLVAAPAIPRFGIYPLLLSGSLDPLVFLKKAKGNGDCAMRCAVAKIGHAPGQTGSGGPRAGSVEAATRQLIPSPPTP